VNKGFAQQHQDMVAGLVEGLLEGNRMVRDNPDQYLDLLAKAFSTADSKWDRSQAKEELAKVHLANLPENQAFFSGAIDTAGSFGGIFQSANLAYGAEIIKNPADGDRFIDTRFLEAIDKAGKFAGQKIAIAPIRTGNAASTVEGDPLLTKDIRFFFEPNKSILDMNNKDNVANLESINKLLKVSPGSTVLLRGHVDNAMIETFRKQGGEAFVRKQALGAMQLSKDRALEVKKKLLDLYKVDPERLDSVGRGWEEPAGTDSDKNRRVEVQWFTIE